MDAITVLAEDHHALSALLARAEQSGPDVPEQRQVRKDLVNRMVIIETEHEKLAAEFFWPVVRDRLPQGVRLASSARAREQCSKHVLTRLDRMPADEPEFQRLFDQVIEDVRAHLAYERDVVWPAVREALHHDQLEQLGERMAAAKAATPPGYDRKS
jgi:hypothetical protein